MYGSKKNSQGVCDESVGDGAQLLIVVPMPSS